MTQNPSGSDPDGEAASWPEHPADEADSHPPADDPETDDSPPRAPSRRGLTGLYRLKREARVGLAMLLSFLILVTVLVINKGKSATRSGKLPPVAKIENPESSSSRPGDSEDGPKKGEEPVVSRPPTAPPVAETAAVPDLHTVSEPPSTAPKVPEPVAEPFQLTGAEHDPVPLPTPTEEAPATTPAGAEPLQAQGTGVEPPVSAPGLDLPSAPLPSMASETPAPSTGSMEMPPPSVPAPTPTPIPGPTEAPAPIAEAPANPVEPSTIPDGSIVQTPNQPPSGSEPPMAGPGGDMVAAEVPPLIPVPPTAARQPEPDLTTQQPGPPMVAEEPAPVSEAGPQVPPPSEGTLAGPAEPPPGPGGPSDHSTTIALPSESSRRTDMGDAMPGSPAPAGRLEAGMAEAPTAANPFAGRAGSVGAGQGGWVALPNSASLQTDSGETRSRSTGAGPALTKAGSSDFGSGELGEPVPHVVQSGENFWTISRLYYGSGRFYMALWKANSGQVPAPEKLRVNQTIRIPPPEALDRSLIQPARSTSASPTDASPSMHHASRPVLDDGGTAAHPSEVELALPVSDPFAARPRISRIPGGMTGAAEVSDRPRLLVYKVRPHETLRSIARDTLGDSRRAGEILELNRGVIDDPNHLTTGQLIDLPADARLARRAR